MSAHSHPSPGTIVVLTAGGAIPDLIVAALENRFAGRVRVIEEKPESRLSIVRRRARRLGWLEAVGQLATMICSRLGKRLSAPRWAEIMTAQGPRPVNWPPVDHVLSLNDAACRDLIRDLAPAAVVTVSCRILSSQTLAEMPCPVINFHSGINPAYRGQMGGYWALAEGDRANFGACVHLVDPGIDTGGILYEKRLAPAHGDTISTYPLLLTMSCRDIVVKAVEDCLAGDLKPYSATGPSHLRYPPAIWTWIANGLRKGIW